MKITKILKHVIIIAAALFVIIGIPFLRTDYFAALVSGDGADATSSASVILDTPSGSYVVLINRAMHTDEEAMNTWADFFEGKEISYIFEDIRCTVAKQDANGLEMAKSYQSRLPENQMTVEQQDAILMLSKAGYGKFDILVLSKEMADAYGIQSLTENTDIVTIQVEDTKQ